MTDRQAGEQERELTPTRDGVGTASPGEDLSQQHDSEQLVHEIEETRAELGETVDALAQKADVKARVSEKVEQRKAAMLERQEDVKARVNGARERVSRATEERPLPAIAVALGLGLLIGRAFGRR
jgi:ElaB/YqjD/DUF883 family membrane-anchored ribosome-binding protein